jgi:hypothetical protein
MPFLNFSGFFTLDACTREVSLSQSHLLVVVFSFSAEAHILFPRDLSLRLAYQYFEIRIHFR